MTKEERKKYIDIAAAEIEAAISYIYCHNCKYNDRSECDECNRKAMGWSISPDMAEEIAKKIFKE